MILADNSEFATHKPENLIDELGVAVKLCRAYSPNKKGAVESGIKLIKTGIMKEIPGVREKARKRCTSNPKKNATETLNAYIQQVITRIEQLNNRILKHYPKEFELIKDQIEPTPVNIFRWSLINKSGALREYSERDLKLGLMYFKENCSLTYEGIRFANDRYISYELKEGGVFSALRKKGTKHVKIFYDPRRMEQIYVRWERKLITFYAVNNIGKHMYAEEIEALIDSENSKQLERNRHNQNNLASAIADIGAISREQQIKKEKRLQNKQDKKLSPKIDREINKQAIAQKEGWEIAEENQNKGQLSEAVFKEPLEKSVRLNFVKIPNYLSVLSDEE